MSKLNIRACIKFLRNSIWYKIRFFRKNIYVHPSAYVSRYAVLRTGKGGRIEIGPNCDVHDYSMILAYGGEVVFGSDSSLNPFSIAYGHGGLRIGSGVRIAAHVTIIPANHIFEDFNIPLRSRGVISRGITILDNVWVGAGVQILDGVEIGTDAVIGAGSVVTKNVEPRAIVVGIPAKRLIRSL